MDLTPKKRLELIEDVRAWAGGEERPIALSDDDVNMASMSSEPDSVDGALVTVQSSKGEYKVEIIPTRLGEPTNRLITAVVDSEGVVSDIVLTRASKALCDDDPEIGDSISGESNYFAPTSREGEGFSAAQQRFDSYLGRIERALPSGARQR